jgi:hypothetical protein
LARAKVTVREHGRARSPRLPPPPPASAEVTEPVLRHRRRAGRGIVFLGVNPSYGPGDDPRWGCDFETFDRHWRESFDSDAGAWPLLYQRYQGIGAGAVDGFRLGEDALVLEVIRYRSASSEGLWKPAGVFQHEGPRTLALLREVAPKVVLCCGSDALWCLRALLPSLRAQLPERFRIGEEEGRIHCVEADWGDVTVIGARHLTGARPSPSRDDRLRLGDRLRDALGTLPDPLRNHGCPEPDRTTVPTDPAD